MSPLAYPVIALKFIVPTLLLRFPFPAAWGNYILDVIDGDILLSLGLTDHNYQTIDKVADYYSYIFMLLLGLNWKIRKTIIALFIYRSIGQVAFFVTRDELMFVYFQNFLEPLVMAYTLLIFLKKGSLKKAHQSYQKHFKLVWAVVIGYKLWNEWYLHWTNIDLSMFFFGVTG